MMSGPGHAGDMPNLHVPASGALDLEVLNAPITAGAEAGLGPGSVGPGGSDGCRRSLYQYCFRRWVKSQ
jgi:hypothetical protein